MIHILPGWLEMHLISTIAYFLLKLACPSCNHRVVHIHRVSWILQRHPHIVLTTARKQRLQPGQVAFTAVAHKHLLRLYRTGWVKLLRYQLRHFFLHRGVVPDFVCQCVTRPVILLLLIVIILSLSLFWLLICCVPAVALDRAHAPGELRQPFTNHSWKRLSRIPHPQRNESVFVFNFVTDLSTIWNVLRAGVTGRSTRWRLYFAPGFSARNFALRCAITGKR